MHNQFLRLKSRQLIVFSGKPIKDKQPSVLPKIVAKIGKIIGYECDINSFCALFNYLYAHFMCFVHVHIQ